MQETFEHINDDLLVKYLLEEATDIEISLVKDWLSASPDNYKHYEHFKLIWERSKVFNSTNLVDTSAAWEKLQRRIHNTTQKKHVVLPIKRFQWLKIAALFILISGITFFLYKSKNDSVPLLTTNSQNAIVNDTLPDGSVVTLNKNSFLSYPKKFVENKRIVSLQGEAFFKITPNKDKPFIININNIKIKVIGTSFNVKSINGNTEVIVETGIVLVEKQNRSIELKPREKIIVKPQDTVLKKESENDKLYNYYRTKEFICDNTPLWKLVESLNSTYNSNIIVEREELKNLLITTTFKDEPLDKILSIISETFNITIVKKGQQILLK